MRDETLRSMGAFDNPIDVTEQGIGASMPIDLTASSGAGCSTDPIVVD